MSDLRIERTPDLSQPVRSVADGQRQGDQHERKDSRRDSEPRPGSEELAIALTEDGNTSIKATLEEDEAGQPVVRVVNTKSGETLALLTPEELRQLAEETGLPVGMLLQVAS